MTKKDCRFCASLTSLADSEKLVEYRDGILHIGGLIPTDPQLEELARESELLGKTNLWKILTETVKTQAIDMGIRRAKDFDELMFAKAMLHIVEVQQSVINAVVKENSIRKKKNVL
jgi:hypothetical protein